MDLKIFVLLLISSLQVKSEHLEIPGCVFSKVVDGYSVYNCPDSTEPDFYLAYNHGISKLILMCNKENNLENISRQPFSVFDKLNSFITKGCNSLPVFSLLKWIHSFNITMAKVSGLTMDGSYDTTIMPQFLQNPSKYVSLNITYSWFIELKQHFFQNFINLEKIELVNSLIEEIGPDTFENLNVLKFIKMQNLILQKFPNNLFRNNKQLGSVQFIQLNITELPPGFLSNLNKLEHVLITKTNLMHIPSDLFINSPLIRQIDLTANQLRQLPEGLFDRLSYLEVLHIPSNKLEAIPKYLFRDLKNLKVLNLRENHISQILSGLFRGLWSLTELYLDSNMIMVIEPMSMLPFAKSLVMANFNSNRISFPWYLENNQPSPFKNFTKLETLNLGNNNISMIFEDWLNMENLKYLNLEHNNLKKLTEVNVNFKSPKLEVDLSGNKIGSIEFNATRLSSETWNMQTLRYVTISISENPIICNCKNYNFKRLDDSKGFWSSIDYVRFDMSHSICDRPNEITNVNIADVKSKHLLCDSENTTTKAVCPYPCCKFSSYKNADLAECSNHNITKIKLVNGLLEKIEPNSFDTLELLTFIQLDNLPIKKFPINLFRNNNQLARVHIINLNITELPRGFLSNLAKLTIVRITSTNLEYIPNDTFINSTNIKEIDLSANQLQKLPERLFYGLSYLEVLHIQSNKLKAIPDYLFRDLKNLKVLNLRNNYLSNITDDLFNGLWSLTELYLDFNMIMVIEPMSMMPFAKSLVMANLNSNRISFPWYQRNNKPSPFKNCTKLETLNLGNNNISMIFEDWLLMKTLKYLDLQHNNLATLTEINVDFKSPKLEVDLTSNKIAVIKFTNYGLSSETWNMQTLRYVTINISENRNLKKIKLVNGLLEEIEANSFDTLELLTFIQLYNLPIQQFPNNLFRNNKKLARVQINTLNITELPSGFLSNLVNLTFVRIANTNLTSIPNDTFSNSTSIGYIDLTGNQLQQLPEGLFSGLSSLKKLHIQSNKLQSIPNDLFQDLKALEMLNLEDNHISTIKNNLFNGLSSLTRLYLNSNMIKIIEPESMLPFAQSLEYANLQSNMINLSQYQLTNHQSPFKNCKKLEKLILGNNSISIIFEDWRTMENLTFLDLQYNNLTKLTDVDVDFTSRNLVVNLISNKIGSIDFNADRLKSETRENQTLRYRRVRINISENPIICDCNLYNFKLFNEKKLARSSIDSVTFVLKPLICDGPDEMTNVNIADVKSEYLFCNSTTKAVCPYPCSCEFNLHKNADLVDCSNLNLTEAPYEMFPSKEGVEIHLNLTGNKLIKLPSKGQPNYNLVTELYASHNQIEIVKESNIITNLKVLDLDHNKLTKLEKNTVYAIQESSNLSLRLSSNLWSCDCESEESFYFLKEYSQSNESDVVCFKNNISFSSLKFSDVCPDSNTIIIVGVSVSLIAVTCAIITILYYRFNIEIKIWIKNHKSCLCPLARKELEEEKPYDAYISYSPMDEHFVMSELVRKLRALPQCYKLCLQYRDRLEGEPICRQVKKSVEESKRIIIVLTRNYLANVWGAKEYLTLLKESLIMNKTKVIVVVFGDVSSNELKTYLQWDIEIRWDNKRFLDKLCYAMPRGSGVK